METAGGDQGTDQQEQREAQVRDASPQALQHLWAFESGLSQVGHLPHLHENHGAPRRDPGAEEGELVGD